MCQILRKFDMNILQNCPPQVSCVAILPWEIRKSHFQHYYSCTSDYLRYLRRKQTATVVQQLQLFTYCCLVLAIICIALVLRLGHTAGGARVLIWTWDMLRLAAAACCDMG